MIDDFTTQHLTNPRVQSLLASGCNGSIATVNEQVRAIVAQDTFKTNDPKTQEVKDRAMILATESCGVLICGESGTGKELIANIIHGSKSGQLVSVNCTAIPGMLFESELFGHTKGSFTGAVDTRSGLLSHANKGTLFLDEIGDLPLDLQPKLLRVLQTKKFRMVGSNTDLPYSARVIAATHMDIPKLIREGKFRLDLYHRLAQIVLTIPPLSERLNDVPLFVKDKTLMLELHKRNVVKFEGNVRELENMALRWRLFGEI